MKPFIREIGKLFNKEKQKTDKLFYGIVKEKITANDNVTGYKVSLGGESATIDARKFAGAEVGDTVMLCKLANGSMIVLGRKDGDKDAIDAQDTANEAYVVAEDAEDTAEDALNAVDVVQSHFWTDSNGVHVTQNESSTAGKNVLINSNGMIIANGNPATTSNQLATFGASKIELGKNSIYSIIEMCGGMFKIEDDTSSGFNDISLIPKSSSMGTGISIYSDEDKNSSLTMAEEYIGLKGGYCDFSVSHDISGDRWKSNCPIVATKFTANNLVRTGTSTTSNKPVYITQDGELRPYTGSSSVRVKKNIKGMTSDLHDRIKMLYELPVKLWKYKSDHVDKEDEWYDKELFGIIAEELDEILPMAISHDKDGNVENYHDRFLLNALLVLLQDQKKEIDQLKARVDSLENK